MSEQKPLSSSQKDAINYQRELKAGMASNLCTYLEYSNPFHASTSFNAIERSLSQRRKKPTVRSKTFPMVHMLPETPRTAYVAIPIDRFMDGTETLHVSDCLATTNVMRAIFHDRITFSLNKFTPICCPASMFRYILKSGALNRHPLKSKAEKFLELEMVTDSDYIVRVEGLLDACDIVACPDRLLFSSLPEIVRKRIERHGFQHLFEEQAAQN